MKQARNYVFFIGLNDKNTKKQEITTTDAYKLAYNLLIEYFWWATIQESFWVYTHEDGTVVVEKSFKCEVTTDVTPLEVDAFIDDAKKVFNQESIMVQVQTDISTFFR